MKKKQILIVEDERVVAEDIKMRLEKLGYSVPGIAFSREEAVKKAEKMHPDLVLMDIVLEGKMDGIDAASAIRSRFDIPVVYLTAHADKKMLERAKVTEPFGYIIKPYEDRELLSIIEIALYKHKTEKTLRVSKASFHNIVEKSVDGLIIVDRDGIVRFVNQSAENIFSVKAKEFIGKMFGFPVITGKSTEVDIIRSSGDPGTGDMRVVETEWEDEPASLILIRDITERRRSVAKLERLGDIIVAEKIKMEVMINSMTDGVIMVSEDKEIVVINPAARKALHLDSNQHSEVSFEVISKLLGYDLIDLSKQKKGGSLKNEVSFCGLDYQVQASPVLGGKGEILGTVINLRDISREKEINCMKSELISVVSHELRTPLASIKNAVDIIIGETAGAVNENQRRFLSMADRNINRLSGIINELMDISKIESGKIKIEFKPFDLDAPLDMAIASLTSQAKEKSISIHKEIPSDLPQAYGDSNKLEQIFINLLSNAVKFTPKKGNVVVSAKDYELDRDFIEVAVADTGMGVSPDKLEKIFDRFYQAEESLTREGKGVGLGLAIVKGLVEAHGGKIWAESEEGKGFKFNFRLPKYSPERALKDYLNREIARAGEKDSPLSLTILKIEEFEYLSKAYGKAEAIRILDEVSKFIQDAARKTRDVIKTQINGRVIMILLDTPKEGAFALVARLKEVLSKQTFKVGKKSLKINLVSGIATYPEDEITGDELIKRAQSQFAMDDS